MRRHVLPAALVLVAAVLGGCRQGPGHTRALGAALGTAAGAAIGAAASPCYPGGGALVGATLGLAAGSLIADGIACDQERCGATACGSCERCCPRPAPCRRRCDPCAPAPVVVRRTVIQEHGPPVGTVVSERVVQDPAPVPVVREDAPVEPCDFGYRGS